MLPDVRGERLQDQREAVPEPGVIPLVPVQGVQTFRLVILVVRTEVPLEEDDPVFSVRSIRAGWASESVLAFS